MNRLMKWRKIGPLRGIELIMRCSIIVMVSILDIRLLIPVKRGSIKKPLYILKKFIIGLFHGQALCGGELMEKFTLIELGWDI